MLFGNKNRFAIEWELDTNSGGKWMYGRVGYWVCGLRVGRYELGTTLRDVLFQWERMSCFVRKRTNESLFPLDASEVVGTLRTGMYGNLPNSKALFQRSLDEQWERLDISIGDEVFNGWFLFLVENESIGRFIYQRLDSSDCHECVLDAGEFDRVLVEAIRPLLEHFNQISDL